MQGKSWADNIETIQDAIGYEFQNWHLLQQAFIRKSFSKENGGENNEVLEFIGDKVLDLVVVMILDNEYGSITEGDWEEYHSDLNEGKLTELKKNLVDRTMLAHRIDFLELNKYLLMGKGDINKNVQNQDSVKEDLFEAIIGAVAIDSEYDMDKLYDVVISMLNPLQYIENGFELDVTNYIQLVQEWNQSFDGNTPKYEYLETHDDYKCYLHISDPEGYSSKLFESSGNSKPEARMNAAKEAYEFLCKEGCFDDDSLIDIAGEPDLDNAVSQLNILATKGYISTPKYDFVEGYDKNGNPKWDCTCSIGEYDFTVHVSGSSKKEVKKLCAYHMYIAILDDDEE